MKIERLSDQNNTISIIVPVYNAEVYLRKCIDSILAQSYPKLEIILVDDGSSDLSGIICDEYAKKDNRIIVIHKKNGGASSARNSGLDAANGEYIAFVDSDDTINADMYEKMLNKIIEKDADICICGFKIFYDGYERTISVPHDQRISNLQLWEACLNDFRRYIYLLAVPWNKLYRRELFDRQTPGASLPIRFKEDIRHHQDAVFNVDCCAAAEEGIVFIDIIPCNFDKSVPDSLSKTAGFEHKEAVLVHMRDAMLMSMPQRELEIEKTFECQMSVYRVIDIHHAIIHNKPMPYKLTWNMVSMVLRLSSSVIEKASALLMFFLPHSIYKVIFRLYCKGT